MARTARPRQGRTGSGSEVPPEQPPEVLPEVVPEPEVTAERASESTPVDFPLDAAPQGDPPPTVADLVIEPEPEVVRDPAPESPPQPVDTTPAEPVPEPEPQAATPIEPEPEARPEPVTPPEELPLHLRPGPVQTKVIVQKVGLVPVIIGGAVAAALGWVAAWQGFVPRMAEPAPAAVDAGLTARLDAVEAQVATLAPADPVDLTPLTDGLAALQTASDEQGASLTALSDRIAALEAAPVGSVEAPDLTALQAALDAQAALLATQAERLDTLAAEAQARISATESTVAAIEDTAEAAADAALARAALTALQAALDGGTPFAAPLADLAATGTTLPPELADHAEAGISTLGALQDSFPEAARAALDVARDEGLAPGGGFGAFLRDQFSVRSVTPRDGDDPDAILSRAEAALRENRLSDTLAELSALPEVVRGALAPWTEAAETRQAALVAADALIQSLSAN